MILPLFAHHLTQLTGRPFLYQPCRLFKMGQKLDQFHARGEMVKI